MPYIEVTTNVAENVITDEVLKTLGDTLAKTLDRPRDKCLVFIDAGKYK